MTPLVLLAPLAMFGMVLAMPGIIPAAISITTIAILATRIDDATSESERKECQSNQCRFHVFLPEYSK
jgi:hypothetical protein